MNAEIRKAVEQIQELCDQIDNRTFDLQEYRVSERVQAAVDAVRAALPSLEAASDAGQLHAPVRPL